ncbi:MAG: 2-succinyl-5-enolpyruvyl-6-hydroxy-3-cyclohexene-1-carboxylic-acid synthase [bacterium]|nr:2-succinyl-5-enolpyruvyl-6-hydroxy-3-cyclohexene-1-carboxylic-acid synthase [bacterium]
MTPQPPSIELARTLVRELVAAGVRHAVLCPGSRSAPLAYALAEAHHAGWLHLTVRLDERGAGFVALGLTRSGAGMRPVAVVTTSGTAVANLHPAVLEASHSGDSIVVVSADRPHEWRGTGANQTTDQVGIFAGAPRFAADVPAGYRREAVRGLVTRALAAATGAFTGDPGPVHLNVGLAEPLVPERKPASGHLELEKLRMADWLAGPPPPAVELRGGLAEAASIPAGRRTLLVAGDRAGAHWFALAEAAGWPVLAEPSSGARLPGAIRHYRDLLAAGLGDEAERVVVVGHPTLSRPISRLLARTDTEVVVVSRSRWTDVAGVAAQVCADLVAPAAEPSDLSWWDRWQQADTDLAAALDDAATSVAERVAHAVWEAEVPTLVLGSSNAVRAVDGVAPGRSDGALVVANRGLAGIDGTIATATGLALGTGSPVRALVGDLTFLHDSASLLRGVHEAEVDLQVVVMNDSGGAIFETLEPGTLSQQDALARATFERLFATPQQADLGALAAGFDASHVLVDARKPGGLDGLREVLARPISGRSVVEVRIGRDDLAGAAEARRVAAGRIVHS